MNKTFRRKKQEEPESHNNDRWLLTYSDMITLLLGLFIILYSISQIDRQKLKDVSDSVRKGFGLGTTNGDPVFDGSRDDEILQPKTTLFRIWENLSYSLKRLRDSALMKLGLSEREELKLTFYLDEIEERNFSKDAELNQAFTTLSSFTEKEKVLVTVRVHIPSPNPLDEKKFPNSWEYRAHLASKIAKALHEDFGIPKEKLSVQAFSTYPNWEKNATPEDKARKERLEILVTPVSE